MAAATGLQMETSFNLSPVLLRRGSEDEEGCTLLPVPNIRLENLEKNWYKCPSNSIRPSGDLDVDQVVDRLLSAGDRLQPPSSVGWLSPRNSVARVTFSARNSVVILPDTASMTSVGPPSPMVSTRSRRQSSCSYRSTAERENQESWLLYMFIILYYLSAALGIVVLVPLLILKHQYNGVCLLGARALWETAPSPSTTTHALIIQDVSIRCTIILFYTGLFPVTYASMLAIAHTTSLCRNKLSSDVYETANTNSSTVSGCMNLLLLAGYGAANAVVAIAQLLSACFVTTGFFHWCDTFAKSPETKKYIRSCRDTTSILYADPATQGGDFYSCLLMSLVGSWVLFILWLFQTGVVWLFWMQQAFGRQFYRRSSVSGTLSTGGSMM